ncbi:MAG TPA: hypothetical protein DHU96_13070 [Actinobacteria bacterium]|nr:hypothetical protein [Actinomycetota bacterium]
MSARALPQPPGGGQPQAASQRLQEALDLWSGPALADIPRGPLLSRHAVHLEEQHLRALQLRIQADVQLCRGRELIGELRSLVAMYPLNEWFHGQLGIDPSSPLQRLHQELLTAGDHPGRHSRVPAPGAGGDPPSPDRKPDGWLPEAVRHGCYQIRR